jgi:opacity protein-like surface antigen
MKTMKSICAAAVLALSLSIPAYADDPIPGIIHTPGMTASEPSDAGTLSTGEIGASDTSLDGDISFLVYAEMLWALTAMF